MFRKFLVWVGLAPSDEDKELLNRWNYAKENLGAKIVDNGNGRWRLTLDPEKVRTSPEFKKAQEQAAYIMRTYG